MKNILITGGAGFIGSNFVHQTIKKHPDYEITVLDKLTYAGNLDNLREIWDKIKFVKGDICDKKIVEELIKNSDIVINFAAETHVDRSIVDAGTFVRTDVIGTYELLEASRKFDVEKYIQISTDEVYGSIDAGSFKETDPINPSSPYSASKASGDMIVNSYYVTYGLPTIITRSSNNFGPYQYPEKLIPLFITNLLQGKKVPVYGDGLNVRDWIYVLDNCEGIDTVVEKGNFGEIYNIGGDNERSNIEITKIILKELELDESYIDFVEDRLGHDRRYSLDSGKVKALGWEPKYKFEDATSETIRWYKENEEWWRKLIRD
ncbi:MAG: dTDP-glucose 4,6-dehydratase [Candidatus Altiarchaeales archaeon HGW-Altiarchaeales-3]|nr:MAG: dTDP-glucose 4,6-dehydratase [Candidatus Altiarchaeales archaeon HGW-Altiarchaeales-3]